jgi:transposase
VRIAQGIALTYLRLRDELGPLYRDTDFANLYPRRGQPALPPGKLALVTVMRYAGDLSDRQAADAVRDRIDRKYALGMRLDDPRFHFSALSKFHSRLVAGGAEQLLLDELLEACKDHGLLKARARQRTGSTSVLAAPHHVATAAAILVSWDHRPARRAADTTRSLRPMPRGGTRPC